MSINKSKLFIFVSIICWNLTSCTSYKNIPYFRDISDTSNINVSISSFTEPIIQYDDILSISINTLDGGSSILSMPSIGGSGAGTSGMSGIASMASMASMGGITSPLSLPASSNYRVDKSGKIEIPLIGSFSVNGITTSKLKDLIKIKVTEFYKNPTVDVRFANFKVTVLGEVMRPSTYIFANEKVSILDALGLAGDLTIFGKRENLLLIRDSASVRQLVRINLNSKDILSSPYYYLKQNDILYAEPTKAKIAALDATQTRNYSIISAVLSVIIIIATRVK